MMNINKLTDLIDIAIKESDNYVNTYFHGDEERMTDTKKHFYY